MKHALRPTQIPAPPMLEWSQWVGPDGSVYGLRITDTKGITRSVVRCEDGVFMIYGAALRACGLTVIVEADAD